MFLYLMMAACVGLFLLWTANGASARSSAYLEIDGLDVTHLREPEVEIIEMPALRKLCDNTKWQPGLYFTCDEG